MGPFIRDESLREQAGELFLLESLRENTYSLDTISGATAHAARRLLWNLLRVVALLHGYGFVHNDICLDTVFVYGDFDMECVLLGGFSRISTDMSRANNDCLQIFRTVRGYLGPLLATLPSSWLGNDLLTELWNLSCREDVAGDVQWPYTVQELCRHLQLKC